MSISGYRATHGAWPLLLASFATAVGCNTLVPRAQRPDQVVDAQTINEPDTVEDAVASELAGAATDAAIESIQWDDLQPQNLHKAVKKATGYGPNRQIAKETYLQAEEIYKQAAALPENQRAERFIAAAEKYTEAAERWPNSALEQDALFMAGESYFFADYYPKANECYERLIKAFPNSRYMDTIDTRRFAIARYWLDLQKKNPEGWYAVNLFDQQRPWRDTHGHAMRVYDKIRVDDPTGRLADDATLALATENMANRRFEKADDYYTDLRQAYPTSEHQFIAHFNGMKAKVEAYMGPEYGAKGLDEAEKLIKQMRRQFPNECAAEKEYVDRAAAEIRYKKAEKLFRTAEYYDFRAEYRAAIMYYDRIVKEYEDTPLAERSRTRIPEIAHLPAKPEQYAPWLVDLLPKRDKIQRLLDQVEEYEKIHPREEQPPQGEVSSEILPAAANLPPPPR